MKHIIYSDDENKRWWDGLGKTSQAEILDRMVENAFSLDFPVSLREQWRADKVLSPKQLAAIRKWDR